MRLRHAALAAGFVALAPASASADMADAFTRDLRVGLAAELDYRGRFLTADQMVRGDPPPDRLGRERLSDVQATLARGIVRQVVRGLVDEAVEGLPGLAALRARYEALTTVRLFADGPRAGPAGASAPPAAGGTGPGGSPGPPGTDARVALAWVGFRSPPTPEDHALIVRFRVEAELEGPVPAIELQRGAFGGRIAFDATGEGLTTRLTHRLAESVELALEGGSAGGGSGGLRVGLTISVPF